MMKSAACILIVCSVLASCVADAGEGTNAATYVEPGYFEVAIPAGWTKQEPGMGLSPSEKRIYGIEMVAPAGDGRSAFRMSAHYYAPDNLMDRTPEKYIRVHSTPRPQNGTPFPRLPKAENGRVGGRPARIFGNITSESSAPRSLNARRFAVWESFAVIPLAHGYYALRYSALADRYEEGLPTFESFLASFKPLKQE